MYKRYFTLIIIVFSYLLLYSCQNDKYNNKNGNKEITNNYTRSSFKMHREISFSNMSEYNKSDPINMLLLNDNIILNTINNDDEHFIFVLDTIGDIKNEILKKGRGPNESISFKSLGRYKDKIYGLDLTKRELIWFATKAITSGKIDIYKHYLDNQDFYDLVWLNDSIVVASGDMKSEKKLTYFNINTKNVAEEFGAITNEKKGSTASLKDAYTAYISIRPNRTNMALAYRYIDLLEIYDDKGNLLKSLQGPDGIKLDYIPEQFYARKTKNTTKAFVNSYVTNENIYLLYSGNTRSSEDNIKWTHGKTIMVFSWEGEFKELWKLSEPIYTFAVDEKSNIIYSHSSRTGNIIKAEIK